MSTHLEGHRGTSQFIDIRVKGPDGEMVDDITRKPGRHTVRSARMGLDAIPSAGPTLEPVTPIDVVSMSPKERARLDGKVRRLQRARLNGLVQDSGFKTDGLGEGIKADDDEEAVVVNATDINEEAIVYSSGDVQPRIDDAARGPEFEVDELTLCCEQSRRVAGDKVILEDDLIDRVVSVGDEIDETVSLDALREEEEYAQEQEAFDYDTTARDLRE